MANGYVIAEECNYDSEWRTYAMAELNREDQGDAWDSARRLDVRSRMLFQEPTSRAQAAEELKRWLNLCDPRHPMWLRFQIRRLLYLHKIGRFAIALNELNHLLEHRDIAEDVKRSPVLHCLRGNLHGHEKQHEEAIKDLEKAIGYADSWAEPQLELTEKLLLLGRYARVVKEVETYRENHPHTSPRAQIILRLNRLLALLLKAKEEGEAFSADMLTQERAAIDNIAVPDVQRERWNLSDVKDHLKAKLDQAQSKELIVWLTVLEERIGKK